MHLLFYDCVLATRIKSVNISAFVQKFILLLMSCWKSQQIQLQSSWIYFVSFPWKEKKGKHLRFWNWDRNWQITLLTSWCTPLGYNDLCLLFSYCKQVSILFQRAIGNEHYVKFLNLNVKLRRYVCMDVLFVQLCSKVNVTEDNKEKRYSEEKVTGEFAFFGGVECQPRFSNCCFKFRYDLLLLKFMIFKLRSAS